MNNKKFPVRYMSVVDNIVYILTEGIYSIRVYNLLEKKFVYSLNCPFSEEYGDNLYSGLCVDNNIMALIPQHAKRIWIYSFNEKKWEGIEIDNYVKNEQKDKFLGGDLISGILYLYGYSYRGILAFNTKTHQFVEVLNEENDSGGHIGISTINFKGKIMLPMRSKDIIISIDTSKVKCNLLDVELDHNNANDGITTDGEYIYILKNTGNIIYKINIDICSDIEKIYIEDNFDARICMINGIEYYGNKLLLYGPGNNCYVLDLENKKKSFYIHEPIYYAKVVNTWGMIMCKNGKIELWNNKMELLEEIDIIYTKDEIEQYLKNIDIKRLFYNEDSKFGIKELLMAL